jgi:AmpE protein
MTFIVTLIALLIERFFDWGHLRRWNWYGTYQGAIMKRFPKLSPYIVLALTIIPLLIVVALIAYLFQHVLYGFIELLFEVLILIYCLGPQNLWADAFSCINALIQGDAQFAADKLKTSFGITDINASQSLHRNLLNHIFIEANRRVFAVVFWYAVLGPVGAILYRAVSLTAAGISKQEMAPELSHTSRSVEALLDWIPVRLFTFFFALSGHFVQVFACFRKYALRGLSSNETMLTECGMAALGSEDQGKMVEDSSVEKAAISLLDRTFVILLALTAIESFLI